MLTWSALAWRSHAAGDAGKLAWLLGAHVLGWACLGSVAWQATDRSAKTAAIILGWALAFRLCGLLAEPVLEDDYFRYLWDGRQSVTTGNPYALPPADFFPAQNLPAAFVVILDGINHPHTPTVYGPTSQGAFALAYLLAPGRLWPLKLLLLLAEAGLVLALRTRLPPQRLLLLAWCPLAVFETAFNAHPDVLGVALLTLAWTGAAGAGSPVLTGVLLALSGGTKSFGWLLLPFTAAPRRGRTWAAFGLTLALLYGPFFARGTGAEFPGLRAMASDWEFNSSLYGLAAWGWGSDVARVLSFWGTLLALAGIGWHWHRNPRTSPPPGDAVFGVLLLFSATVNPWYLLWIWPFVALRPSATGVTALAVVTLSYCTGQNLGRIDLSAFDHPDWLRPVEFGLLAVAGMADWTRWRRRAATSASTPIG